MAHWQAGAQGRGVLFAGDAIFPKPDGMVTFMRSYPNMIPLSAAVVRRLAAHASRYDFDTLFNNFGPRSAGRSRQRASLGGALRRVGLRRERPSHLIAQAARKAASAAVSTSPSGSTRLRLTICVTVPSTSACAHAAR